LRASASSARAVPPQLNAGWSPLDDTLHTPFQATKRVVGLIVLLLAATLIWPFPFSHIIRHW
jgi:hypothetical protein